MKIINISKDQFEHAVNDSYSIANALRLLGYIGVGGNYKTFYKLQNIYNVDISHFTGKASRLFNKVTFQQKSLSDVLCENSEYSRASLKKRLIDEGILLNDCYICELKSEWNNKPLVLILDHINGINNDNRIENLRLVCPNCNSQLSTFCGRNRKCGLNSKCNKKCIDCESYISDDATRCVKCHKKASRKVVRPSKYELSILINTNSIISIGKMFNVSDSAIRKWCKSYEIESPKRHSANSYKNAILKE
jgi:hypothetical protein